MVLIVFQAALLDRFQFKKQYCISPLKEPLLCLFLCIPFWFLRDIIPENLWGKAIFLIGGIPFLFIWLASLIYKLFQHPKLFEFDLTANRLIIDDTAYSIDELTFFYISKKDDAFKMEFEFPSPQQFKAGYSLKTLSIYTLDSSLQAFNDSIKNIKNIKTFISD